MKHFSIGLTCLCFMATVMMSDSVFCQTDLITNIPARSSFSLDGQWQYIIDPYETGIYDYRHEELSQKDPQAYWNPDKPKNKSDRKEYGYIEKNSLRVATVHWKEVF